MSSGHAGLGSVTGFLQISDGPGTGSATGFEIQADVSQWWTSGDSGVTIDTPTASIALTDQQAANLARLLILAALGYIDHGPPSVAGYPLTEYLADIVKESNHQANHGQTVDVVAASNRPF